ncbi:MAG: leucine-rich repeat protein [Clostridia bacterium]|nr:leucine-rich repeat protein [Clostridia bacterium]
MIAMLVFLLAVSALAAEVNGVYYDLDARNQVAKVNKDNRTATTEIAVIPSTIEYEGVTYKVTGILNDAFYDNKSVKEIRILSEYITQIPSNMIANTYDGKLTKIYIDFSNITSIGSAAFNPSNQTNGNNPVSNSFYYYDARAFIENGTDVIITEPDFSNLTSIGSAAFQGANFEKVTIPAAVYIKNQMFRKSTIKELVIEGEDRAAIEYYAFQDCRSLEKITIKSKNLNSIGNDLFSCATALKEIHIDLSKCESVKASAFQFANNYDSGNNTVQWYNLEGEKIVDLSSMKHFYNRAFCSSNIGSAKIIWPNAIETLEDQAFRKCNIVNQPMLISAAEGKTLSLSYYAFDGNNPSIFICNEGVTTLKNRFDNCKVVLLAPSVTITGDGNFRGENGVVYYKSFAEGSKALSCASVQMTDATVYNYGLCGVVAEVTTLDGNVTVGTVSHTTESAIDNALCPIGKVLVTECKYCDYIAYSVDGVATDKKEHNFDLSSGAIIGGIAYESYFEMGFETTVCAFCEATKNNDVATAQALFTWKGYAVSTFGETLSMTQGFVINTKAIEAYMECVPSFEFGLIAAGNKNGEAFSPELSGDLCIPQSKIAHDYFDIKITGITQEHMDSRIIFCAYVKVGDKVYYLDNNATLEAVTGFSYNEVLAMQK